MVARMSTSPTATADRVEHPPPSTPTVVAVMLFVDEASAEVALDAVERQVYEVSSTVIVGGGERGAGMARGRGLDHYPTLREFLQHIPSRVDAVWMLHGDARPRPDALRALVAEMERNEASMAGSKILDADHPDVLESVGSATDVFGEPYSGLDPGEVDLEQYDVVRDVAFLSGVSVLVRRDLLKGLRGVDPVLAPVAAGQDLSQRVRVAGGRVMVVPSSEVLHSRRCGHDVADWRELAGRMRSMVKAYRWVTLAWVLPVGALIGLFEGITRLVMGQPQPLLDHFRAAGWNILRIGNTLRERRSLDRVRAVGDEELFRYQVSGSVRLRQLATDIGERLGWAIGEEPGIVPEEEIGAEVGRAGPVMAGLVLAAVGLTARRLWFGGLPQVGFSLPSAAEAWSVLDSFAGGWNPAGLGSPEPLHPAPAAVAAVQLLVGGWAQSLIAITAMVLGVAGTARLLTRLGVDGASRYLAALVGLFGPFASILGAAAYWPGIIASAALPWVVAACLSAGRPRMAEVGGLILASVLVSAFAPAAFVVPLVAVAVALPVLRIPAKAALGRAGLAAAAGYVGAAPYLVRSDPAVLFSGLPRLSRPSPVLLGVLLAASVVTILVGDERRQRPAVWGGTLIGLGMVGLAVFPEGEAAVAAAGLGGVGAAVAVGAALPFDLERSRVSSAVDFAGSLAAVVVVGATLLALPAGRATLPPDQWSGRLDFVEALAPSEGPGRVLLVGEPDSLPGEWRIGNGYAYRLVWGSLPTLDQAWLPAPRAGDRALAEALARLDAGDVLRPGGMLAEFGVRWIVVLDRAPLADSLRAQADLASIPLTPDLVVFENQAARPRVDAAGWTEERIGGSGPAGDGTVRLADNASDRWGPAWRQDGWANRMSAEQGTLVYRNDPLGWWLAVLAGVTVAAGFSLAVVGRFRR